MLLGVAAVLCAVSVGWINADARPVTVGGPTCELSAAGGYFGDQTGVLVDGKCEAFSSTIGGAYFVQTRSVSCTADGIAYYDGAPVGTCGPNVPACKLLLEGGQPGDPFVYAFQYQSRMPGGAWEPVSFYCPQSQAPVAVPDAATIRDQVVRLLPRVGIGMAGPTKTSLVNIQTLFWARTDRERSLGRVSVVGSPVWLKISFDRARWAFGDGQTDIADGPGKPYDDARDPCAKPLCPDYYGHIYRIKGPMTVSLRVSWTATFSLNGRNFVPVAGGPITGPETSDRLTVREARAVLVPAPGD